MEWLLALAVVLLILWIGWSANRQQGKERSDFLSELQHQTEKYQALMLRDSLPEKNPAHIAYRPISNEKIYGMVAGALDNRNGVSGRLIVTSKAIVFETQSRSDRFPLTSLSAIDIAHDGFSLRKRNGPVRPFRTGSNPDFLALVQVISWGLR